MALMQRLSDKHWELVRAYFPEENSPEDRASRKPVPTRDVPDAVLWMLNAGAQWHRLLQCYLNDKTVHRRCQRWGGQEILRQILTDVANALSEQGFIDEREAFIDATSASAKGGGCPDRSDRVRQGREDPGDRRPRGQPSSVSTHAANHHEVTLVQPSIDFYLREAEPEQPIGDKAYDSDTLGRSGAGGAWR